LNSIYNKYPASTCSVQGNNDNQRDHHLRIEIKNTKLVESEESPKCILSLSKSNIRPLVKLFCGTGRKVISWNSFNKKQNFLNSIYNKYPASTCSVQGNNDSQNTRSEADLLYRLEQAFNKVTMQTKEMKTPN
jgi:predicted phosphodiesterase